jgi:hypothetical protein
MRPQCVLPSVVGAVAFDDARVDTRHGNPAAFQPTTEIRNDPDLKTAGQASESLVDKQSCERINMLAQRPLPHTIYGS